MTKLIVILSVLALLAFAAVPALAAAGPCDSNGAGYGQDHIAAGTPHGPPDAHHNPGTAHQGYSFCLGVH